MGWAIQGVPLLAHLVSEDSRDCWQQAEFASSQAANHADRACSSDLGRESAVCSDRTARPSPEQHSHRSHHDPLDCQTCKILLMTVAWAVPHVTSLEFFGWTAVGAVEVATTQRAISFEFRALAAPRGPPMYVV